MQSKGFASSAISLFSGRLMHENQAEACTDISLAIYSTTQQYNAQQELVAGLTVEMELALAAAIVEPTTENVAQAAVAVAVWENETVYSSEIRVSLDILATMYSANGCWE